MLPHTLLLKHVSIVVLVQMHLLNKTYTLLIVRPFHLYLKKEGDKLQMLKAKNKSKFSKRVSPFHQTINSEKNIPSLKEVPNHHISRIQKDN
jgi:tmRNA-binding protein